MKYSCKAFFHAFAAVLLAFISCDGYDKLDKQTYKSEFYENLSLQIITNITALRHKTIYFC